MIWGSGTYIPQIRDGAVVNFLAAITNSTYLEWLSRYSTVGLPGGTNQIIGRGSAFGASTITPSPAAVGSTVDDSAIQTELTAQITAGHLPQPDLNTVYVLFFPSGQTITHSGLSSLQPGGFCSYHGSVGASGGLPRIAYIVMPDLESQPAACGSGTAFQQTTTVLSGQLLNAITDPTRQGWFDPTNREIGDICFPQSDSAFSAPDGTLYTVQLAWDNLRNTCVDGFGPTVILKHTTDGQNGWNVSSPVAETADFVEGAYSALTCTVDGSNVMLSGVFPAWTFQVAGDGSRAVACTVTDAAGNRGYATDTVNIDTTPPVAAVQGVTDGAVYALGAVPAASCQSSDPGANAIPPTGSGVATPASLSITGGTTSGVGQFVASCAGAVDVAGNTAATATATYTVAGPPTAQITAPLNNQTYKLNQSVTTSFSCSEESYGPGLASCDDSNGTSSTSGGSGTLNTSTVGSHTYTVAATSTDGQTATASITYTVRVTPSSLCLLTKQDVDSSRKFQGLPPALQSSVDRLVTAACAPLDRTVAGLTPAQKAALVAAYDKAVALLAANGWLTMGQANMLKTLAGTL